MPVIGSGAVPPAPWPPGDGEMVLRIRAFDWGSTPLGQPEGWPRSLRTIVETILANPFPQVVTWGRDLVTIHNDAYLPLLGRRQEALGRPFLEVWTEVRDDLAPDVDRAWQGESCLFKDAPFTLQRGGEAEEAFFDFSFSPVRGDDGGIEGVLAIAVETTRRVQTDRDVRQSEARLRAVLEQMGVGVAIAAIPSGELLYHNARAVELLGHPLLESPDYTGYARYGALHDDGTPYAPEQYPMARAVLGEERVAPEEMRYRRGDGTVTRLQVGAGRVHDDARRPILAVSTFEDVAERHAAEAAQRESEARFRALAEQAVAGIAMVDIEGCFVFVNDRFCEIVGRERSEVIGRHIADITHSEDWHGSGQTFKQWVEEMAPHVIEKRYVHPDGSIVWVRTSIGPRRDASGVVLGGYSVCMDITDRHVAEVRLRSLVEGIPQLVWRAVDRGAWTWSSPQWSAFTGMSEADSRGHGWLDAVHPEDRETAQTAWDEAADSGRFSVEYRIGRTAGGGWRWFRVQATPVMDDNGRIVEWLGTCTDIDDLRRLQDQQEVMVAELQHRTRNLLAIVQSIAQQTLALGDGSLETFEAEFSSRLSALSRVQGLLSGSDQEPVTIEALVRMELQALGAEPDGARIAIGGPEVRLRSRAVQTFALALHELATNARKHGALAAPAGRLTVSWCIHGTAGEPRRLEVEWTESGVSVPSLPPGDGHRRGYGRTLIERALPYALGARTRFDLRPDGLHCIMDLPLAQRGETEVAG